MKWVLIVDDERATAWALAESLREDGLGARIAHSVAEAESQLTEHPFDLLITDVRLPDRSGLDLLHELAADDRLPLAIVVSAFGGSEVESALSEYGALAYYEKPFDLDSLCSTVTSALGVTTDDQQ